MKSPREMFGRPSDAEQIGPTPKNQLDAIMREPITPENIETYLDDALEKTVNLAEHTVKLYGHIRKHPHAKRTKLEDLAFHHFGLQSVPEILDLIAKRRDEMAEVRQFIETEVTKAPHVIVPPDEGQTIVQGGESTYEKPGIKNRLQTLLYVLKVEGISLSGITVQKGEMLDTMFRKESYVAITIPSLKRLALICDEEGNASYMFDTEKLLNIAKVRENELLIQKTKQELNEIIVENPGVGVRFVYTSRWTDRVRGLLSEPIPSQVKEPPEPSLGQPPPPDVRLVSTSELDPWRGFWTDPDGKHWGNAQRSLAKINLWRKTAPDKFTRKMRRLGIRETVEITNLMGEEEDGFCYEDIMLLLQVNGYLEAPKSETKGEWSGFWTNLEGKHIGSVRAIARKLEAGVLFKNRLDFAIKAAHPPPLEATKIFDIDLDDMADGYCFEDVISHQYLQQTILNILKKRVEKEGEWRGFYVENNVHYGSYEDLCQKAGFTKPYPGVDTDNMRSAHVIGLPPLNRLTQVHAYEDFLKIPLIQEMVNAPYVESTGAWRDFYTDPTTEKHYAPLGILTRALEQKHPLVMRIVSQVGDYFSGGIESLVQRNNLEKRVVRHQYGFSDAYAIEDVEPLIQRLTGDQN